MKLELPRKRTLLAWHRWMGIVSAIFLIIVSITGLALNHSEFLKLDKINIHNGFILKRYGMETGESIQSYRIHQSDTLSHFGGQLFYNSKSLTSSEAPLAILEGEPITAIATPNLLITITSDGELIEAISMDGLSSLGVGDSAAPVLVTSEGLLTADSDWIEFSAYTGSYSVAALNQVTLPQESINALLENFQGNGVPLYRVLLDLHSGRLFGWGGRTLMDLTAIAVLLLVSSGLAGWLRKSRRKPPVRHV